MHRSHRSLPHVTRSLTTNARAKAFGHIRVGDFQSNTRDLHFLEITSRVLLRRRLAARPAGAWQNKFWMLIAIVQFPL